MLQVAVVICVLLLGKIDVGEKLFSNPSFLGSP